MARIHRKTPRSAGYVLERFEFYISSQLGVLWGVLVALVMFAFLVGATEYGMALFRDGMLIVLFFALFCLWITTQLMIVAYARMYRNGATQATGGAQHSPLRHLITTAIFVTLIFAFAGWIWWRYKDVTAYGEWWQIACIVAIPAMVLCMLLVASIRLHSRATSFTPRTFAWTTVGVAAVISVCAIVQLIIQVPAVIEDAIRARDAQAIIASITRNRENGTPLPLSNKALTSTRTYFPREDYYYERLDDTHYELCTTFQHDTQKGLTPIDAYIMHIDTYEHTRGQYCYRVWMPYTSDRKSLMPEYYRSAQPYY